jgi:predicted  nucleic acid-binding Zn-ribbon protein
MAQVVQQRTSPYLTVILVFTTVIFLGVAVLMHVQKSDLQESNKQLEQRLADLANSTDLNNEMITQLRNRAAEAKDGDVTVLSLLRRRISDLASRIDSGTDTYTGAMKAVETLQKQHPEAWGEGLAKAVEDLSKKKDGLEKQLQALQQSKQDAADVHQKKVVKLEAEKAQLVTEKQALQQQVNLLPGKISEVESEYTQKIGELRTQHDQQLQEKDQRIAQLRGELQDAQFTVQTKEQRINTLSSNLADARNTINDLRMQLQNKTVVASGRKAEEVKTGQSGASIDLAASPDGRILRVVDDAEICYINLGRSSNLQVDTSFAVFDSQKSITQDNVKATLVVTKVTDVVSECRIAAKDPENPILVGDPIVNVAFDSSSSYSFYVIGEFDLTGGNQATAQGRRQVQSLIREAGGTIAEDLGIQTDFLVAGVRPDLPPEPREGADLPTRAAYQDALRQRQQYEEDKALAAKLGVQILNTNRFKAFMGLNAAQAGDK